MYKIIGADGKAYGPVTPEQIRQWINESRINAQTQVQAEGTLEWKPLSEFPEFADLLGANTPAAPSIPGYQAPGLNRDKALQDIKGPAIGILVSAILGMVAVVLSALRLMVGAHNLPLGNMEHVPIWALLLGHVFALVIYGIVCFGAVKMQRLEKYSFAFAASILAMLPCSACCIVGVPFGIWALVVLNRPDIKSQFN